MSCGAYLRVRFTIAAWLLGISLLWSAPSRWVYPDAMAVIRVAPLHERSHTVHVPIPLELQAEVRGVRAQTVRGDDLPCVLLSTPRAGLAAEVYLSFNREDRVLRRHDLEDGVPIEIYLFSEPRDGVSFERTPVVLRAGKGLGVARPGTCETFLGYWQRYAPLVYRGELASLADKPDFGRLERDDDPDKQKQRRYKIIWQLSTTLRVTMAREIVFGVPNGNHGAWFLFVNRQPVFSWGQAEQDVDGFRASPRQLLEPGSHQIDFFGILEVEEEVPVLSYREVGPDTAYQRFGLHELWSPNQTMSLEFARQEDVLVQGVRLNPLTSWSFTGTGAVLDRWRYEDLSRNVFDRALTQRRLRLGERELPQATGLVHVPREPRLLLQLEHQDQHGFQQQLQLTLSPLWSAPDRLEVEFQPVTMPFLACDQRPVPLNYVINAGAGFDQTLLTMGRLRRTRYDRQGNVIDRYEDTIPASPFRRYFTLLELARDTAQIDLDLTIDGFPVTAPIRLYHVLPEDAPDFQPSAGLLRYRDGLALLARETAAPPAYQQPAPPLRRICLVDGYIATTAHPYDELGLADWLAGEGIDDIAIQHLPLPGNPLDASHPRLSKFVVLPQVLAGDAQAVVWAIGPASLAQDVSVPDFRSELAFLAETTLAHGKLPILVNMPMRGEWSRERLRPYALQVMELAAHYDIPVVDLYSASLKRQNIDVFYRIDDREDLQSATPDAKGRAWFFSRIIATIQNYQPINVVE